MKRVLSLILVFCLTISLCSTVALAKSNDVEKIKKEKYGGFKTKEHAEKLLKDAEEGNEDAIKVLNSLKAFNKKEISDAIKNVKLTADNKVQTIDFGDGSSIEIGVACDTDEKTISDTTESDRELQLERTKYTRKPYYNVKVFEIEVLRYTLIATWYGNQYMSPKCTDLTCTDSASYVFPYEAVDKGATPGKTSGDYVTCKGEGEVSGGWPVTILDYDVTIDFKGTYAGGYIADISLD